MERNNFQEALREADRALQQQKVPPHLDRKLRGGFSWQRRLARWGVRWAPPLAVGVAAAAALLLWFRPAPSVVVHPAELGGLAVVNPSNDFAAQVSPQGIVEIAGGTVLLTDHATATSLSLEGATKVKKEQQGVRILAGSVVVSVEKRLPSQPAVRIFVSHGTIEVLGTRFRIEQRETGGRVDLHHGKIRFTSSDGRTHTLAPGESLVWPLPAETASTSESDVAEPTEPTTPPRIEKRKVEIPHTVGGAREKAVEPPQNEPENHATSKQRLDDVLRRAEVLRSRRRFEEAVVVLREALTEIESRASRERISYELGAILSNRIGDAERACVHWTTHLRAFGSSRYEDEIASARERLGCKP